MKQYKVTLTGLTPLIMHADNRIFQEKLTEWRTAPENNDKTVAGDDRSPAWSWLQYIYHDGEYLGIPSDNLMTMLREGGGKVKTGKGAETFKKYTQSGLIVDTIQFDLWVNGTKIKLEDLRSLTTNENFIDHAKMVEKLGFELFVKPARVKKSKHMRVRPLFRNWLSSGTITVFDEKQSKLTKNILQTILDQAGAFCGICDWRPSSPSSGPYGKFKATVELLK